MYRFVKKKNKCIYFDPCLPTIETMTSLLLPRFETVSSYSNFYYGSCLYLEKTRTIYNLEGITKEEYT